MTRHMTFVFASDHAGVDLKNHLFETLEQQGHNVHDLTPDNNPAEHYSAAADRIAQNVLAGEGVGVLMCGTGLGTLMRANRYKGIRAALVTNAYLAEMARRHNDANVIVFGARVTTPEMAQRQLDVFITTEFDGGRHKPRVASIDAPL